MISATYQDSIDNTLEQARKSAEELEAEKNGAEKGTSGETDDASDGTAAAVGEKAVTAGEAAAEKAEESQSWWESIVNGAKNIAGDAKSAAAGLLDEFQQNVDNFGDLIKDYILSTKITHIAFYYPECPDCHTVPATSYGGFIPYDPMNAFFSLGLTKLVRVASKQQQSNNGLMNS